MPGPITQGKDFNYFKRIAVGNTSFNNEADFVVAFRGSSSIVLINEGNNTIQYSFNGLTIHGDLVPGTPSAAMAFRRNQSLIWFKIPSGAASTVRAEAFNGEFEGMSSATPLGAQTPSNSLTVVSALSTSFATGQLAVPATAQALGSATAFKNGFALSNLSTSSASMFVGTSGVTTSTGFEIAPGTSLVIPVQDISTVYVIAASASTATANWIGFN